MRLEAMARQSEGKRGEGMAGGQGRWEPEHRTNPETHGPGEVAHREARARKIRFAFNKTRLDTHVTRERALPIKSAGTRGFPHISPSRGSPFRLSPPSPNPRPTSHICNGCCQVCYH